MSTEQSNIFYMYDFDAFKLSPHDFNSNKYVSLKIMNKMCNAFGILKLC